MVWNSSGMRISTLSIFQRVVEEGEGGSVMFDLVFQGPPTKRDRRDVNTHNNSKYYTFVYTSVILRNFQSEYTDNLTIDLFIHIDNGVTNTKNNNKTKEIILKNKYMYSLTNCS